LKSSKRRLRKFQESSVNGKGLKQGMPIMGETVQAAGNSNDIDPINV
jgi:hypothetical protein